MMYVLGFVFSTDLDQVALIRKNRPEWQAGRLNAIGGKMEGQEILPIRAMEREFEEETGWRQYGWSHFATLSEANQFSVMCYAAKSGCLDQLMTTTDEVVGIYNVSEINYDECIENLPWLIPLAIDHLRDNRPCLVNVYYPERGK